MKVNWTFIHKHIKTIASVFWLQIALIFLRTNFYLFISAIQATALEGVENSLITDYTLRVSHRPCHCHCHCHCTHKSPNPTPKHFFVFYFSFFGLWSLHGVIKELFCSRFLTNQYPKNHQITGNLLLPILQLVKLVSSPTRQLLAADWLHVGG